jgi:hypothetical protein
LNEKSPQAGVTVDAIVRELPLLPVIGFVFALCYEGMFFFSLSIELRQILTLTDLIEASALKILPVIPVMLVGAWAGSGDPLPTAKNNRQRARNFISNPAYYLIIIMGVLTATAYVLFGLEPRLGSLSSALIVLFLFANFIIFPVIMDTDRRTFLTVWLFIVATVIFAFMGHNDAHNIRFGDRSKLPLVTTEFAIPDANQAELRLVRQLSSGMLVATEARNHLWFINNNNSAVLTFETDPIPFQGILCGGFGWCPFTPDQL